MLLLYHTLVGHLPWEWSQRIPPSWSHVIHLRLRGIYSLIPPSIPSWRSHSSHFRDSLLLCAHISTPLLTHHLWYTLQVDITAKIRSAMWLFRSSTNVKQPVFPDMVTESDEDQEEKRKLEPIWKIFADDIDNSAFELVFKKLVWGAEMEPYMFQHVFIVQ